MPRRAVPASLFALLVAACAAPQTTPPVERCVALFQDYDRITRFPTLVRDPLSGRETDVAVEKALELRRAGCVTTRAELAAALARDSAPFAGESGAAVAPTVVHAGVVTSDADDARVREAFAARGVPARSVGAEGLGRRVYLGPFRTEGGVAAAIETARGLGFRFAYPSARPF